MQIGYSDVKRVHSRAADCVIVERGFSQRQDGSDASLTKPGKVVFQFTGAGVCRGPARNLQRAGS
ncbi:MAG: hypothetical protein NVSMB52_16290 [Chloroflexota bacterium]